MNDKCINNVYVENCCKSYCDGCPWAEEQHRIDKLQDQLKTTEGNQSQSEENLSHKIRKIK